MMDYESIIQTVLSFNINRPYVTDLKRMYVRKLSCITDASLILYLT